MSEENKIMSEEEALLGLDMLNVLTDFLKKNSISKSSKTGMLLHSLEIELHKTATLHLSKYKN